MLDVKPTKSEILAFGSEWYQPELNAAGPIALRSGRRIRTLTGPYFLATKLVAFSGHGQGDYVLSHNIEGIVAVLDGRPETVEEVPSPDRNVPAHLQAAMARLLGDKKFMAALSGHLPGEVASQQRLAVVIEAIRQIADQFNGG